MNEIARSLASRLIRNLHEVELQSEVRAPLYETMAARLGPGTAARKLGAAIDTVPPGKRSCPYHFHIDGARAFRATQRSGQDLDYWEGEP